jgi:hypothetical protein
LSKCAAANLDGVGGDPSLKNSPDLSAFPTLRHDSALTMLGLGKASPALLFIFVPWMA